MIDGYCSVSLAFLIPPIHNIEQQPSICLRSQTNFFFQTQFEKKSVDKKKQKNKRIEKYVNTKKNLASRFRRDFCVSL